MILPTAKMLFARGIFAACVVGTLVAASESVRFDSGSSPVVQPNLTQVLVTSGDQDELPPSICFAPDADPEVVALHSTDAELRAQVGGRWSTTATNGGGITRGTPVVLTYSFVPDGTTINPTQNLPGGTSDLFAFMNGIYGSPDVWQPLFEEMFDRWSELAGLDYVFEPNDDGVRLGSQSGQLGVRGDIRIGGVFLDGPSNVLAYNNFPNNGDMVLDTGDTFYNNTSNNSLRLRNVLSHEHGHGLGFRHVCPIERTKLMEPFASTLFDGPQHDEIRGAHFNYGDRLEPNDVALDAFDMGSLGDGSFVRPGEIPAPSIAFGSRISIESSADSDWFRFTTSEATRVTVSVTPIGLSYDDSPQGCAGTTASCCSGTLVDSSSAADLNVELFDAQLGSVAASDAVGLGGIESLVDVALLEPGEYFVRVGAGAGSTGVQLYDLAVDVDALPFFPLTVDFPGGVPEALEPGVPTDFSVSIAVNDEQIVGTPQLRYRFDDQGAFLAAALAASGPDLFTATLPAAACDEEAEFFITVGGDMSGSLVVPPTGAAGGFRAVVGTPSTPADDDFQADTGWSVTSTSGAGFDGGWERGVPVGGGDRGDPATDFDGSGSCYLTANRDGNSDVDSGSSTLTSPVYDLTGGGRAILSYARWFSNVEGQAPEQDVFVVEVSDDNGASWNSLEVVGPALSSPNGEVAGGWVHRSFDLGTRIRLTDQVRVRFIVSDADPGSIVEAGVDSVRIETLACEDGEVCAADWNMDGILNDQDFFDWVNDFFSDAGPQGQSDFNNDGFENDQDFFDFANGFFNPGPECTN